MTIKIDIKTRSFLFGLIAFPSQYFSFFLFLSPSLTIFFLAMPMTMSQFLSLFLSLFLRIVPSLSLFQSSPVLVPAYAHVHELSLSLPLSQSPVPVLVSVLFILSLFLFLFLFLYPALPLSLSLFCIKPCLRPIRVSVLVPRSVPCPLSPVI